MSDTFDNHPASYTYARSIGCFRGWCEVVTDGDTYKITLDLGLGIRSANVEIRLLGRDTPEIFHPRNNEELKHGLKAQDMVLRLIGSEPVLVRTYLTKGQQDKKSLDRFLGDVYYVDDKQSTKDPWRDLKKFIDENDFNKRANYGE